MRGLLTRYARQIYSKWFKFKHRNNAVIGNGCVFGFKSRIINKTGLKEAVVISDGVMMHGTLIVEGAGKIFLSKKVNIRRDTYIGSICLIEIGQRTIISDAVSIMDNNNHPTSAEDRALMVESGWSNKNWAWINSDSRKITIGEDVWVCQSARILKGVNVGDGSIIAASSVITKHVERFSVYAGNPAKKVKEIHEV